MYRLGFKGYAFEFLSKGKQDLALTPMIGEHHVEFEKDIEVVFRYSRQRFPRYLINGSNIGLYALVYSDSWIKIGTSNIYSIVERMYSQAPRLAIILGTYIVTKDLKREYIEKHVVEELKYRYKLKRISLETKKPEITYILKHRRKVIDNKLMSIVSELIEDVSKIHIEGVEGSLHIPGKYWFTTPAIKNENDLRIDDGILCRSNVVREYCSKKTGCKGTLKIYNDGVCVLRFKEGESNRICTYINTCDWFIWNMVFYNVEL